jgi:hypothetical protein
MFFGSEYQFVNPYPPVGGSEMIVSAPEGWGVQITNLRIS